MTATTERSAVRTPTCTYHCGGCDSHFSSLVAFDSHRKGDPAERYCDEPEDMRRRDKSAALEFVTGTCSVGPNFDNPKLNVRIWRQEGATEQAREAFQRSTPNAEAA